MQNVRRISLAEVLSLPLFTNHSNQFIPTNRWDPSSKRSAYRTSQLSEAEYQYTKKGHIADAVKRQEALDLDVNTYLV